MGTRGGTELPNRGGVVPIPNQVRRVAAIRMVHPALGVRQDAEPRAVGAHGKELSAPRVRAERIAGRVEHDRPSRRVLTGRFRDADAAA